MRKSVSLGGGVRLNASKRGMGTSVGGKGMRYSVHSSGRRTTTVGIPGSGVSYSSSRGGGGGRRRSGAASRPGPPAPPRPPKPGMFASAHEKAFHKGVLAMAEGDKKAALSHFAVAADRDTKDRGLADDLFAGLLAMELGERGQAIPRLEVVAASETELPDALMRKYGLTGEITLGITDAVRVTLPLGSLAAALALAECYQAEGRREEAIGLVEKLYQLDDSDIALRLSLCELLAEEGSWDEVLDLSAGVANTDDASLQVRLYQGQALVELGHDEAAIEAYKECLRSKKRDQELLREARYARAQVYLRLGKRSQAKRDLSSVMADDPGYRDVRTLLEEMGE